MIDETAIRARYEAVKDRLDERGRRLFVAAEKIAAGYGGTAAVSRASEHAREGTGVAHSTITRRAKDLLTVPAVTERVRRKGAGRPALSRSNPAVLEDQRLPALYQRRQVFTFYYGCLRTPQCGEDGASPRLRHAQPTIGPPQGGSRGGNTTCHVAASRAARPMLPPPSPCPRLAYWRDRRGRAAIFRPTSPCALFRRPTCGRKEPMHDTPSYR
jgi:hypothetical protein